MVQIKISEEENVEDQTNDDPKGAPEEQAEALQRGAAYAAGRIPSGWSCEWRIPFDAMGLKAADVKTLQLNLALSCTANGAWSVWVPTGGRACDVDLAGILILRP